MIKVITVTANLKGGSGKSTVTFNLGIWLQSMGETVVAYDLDPQRTLKDVALIRKEEGFLPEFEVNVVSDNNFVHKMMDHCGHVLVDVGAANIPAMTTAINIAQRVIIPVPPSQPDVWATQRFLKIIQDTCGDDAPELVAFINRADTHRSVRESDEAEDALKQIDNIRVLPHRLCQRTNYRRTLSEGLSIFELSGRSKSAEEFECFAHALYPHLVKQ